MANIFWKNFYLCFSKLKSERESLIPPAPQLSSSKHDYHDDDQPSGTVSVFKNFNSFYDLSSSASNSKSLMTSSTDSTADFFSSDSDSETVSSPPDFATIFASHRFFFSSPGRSNSIIESPDTRPESIETPPLDGGVAVKKYSPDPYKDFRFSMQEMIEARNLQDVKSDWEFLHELLLCYLSLNPKHTHKFIVSAFTDILICLLSSSDSETHRRPEANRR